MSAAAAIVFSGQSSSHPHYVIAAVYVQDLPCHSARHVREQKERGIGDLILVDVAAKRRVVSHVLQDDREARDAGRGERSNGAGRKSVDANAARPEVVGQVADAHVERGLGHAHNVVARDYALASQVGEREYASLSPLHQRRGVPGDGRQGVNADLLRQLKALARGGEVLAVEVLLLREGDAVNHEVEAAEAFSDLREYRLYLGILRHVALQDERVRKRGRELARVLFDPLALVGEGDARAFLGGAAGDGPGQAALVGDSEDYSGLSV